MGEEPPGAGEGGGRVSPQYQTGIGLLHRSLSPHTMSAHAALIIPSPSTISFSSSCRSRPALDAKELIATLETIDELRRRDSAVSKDDSRIDYTSVLNIEDKKRRFSEDLVDCETKSNIQMKKIYRQIQRQVHCDENTEV